MAAKEAASEEEKRAKKKAAEEERQQRIETYRAIAAAAPRREEGKQGRERAECADQYARGMHGEYKRVSDSRSWVKVAA